MFCYKPLVPQFGLEISGGPGGPGPLPWIRHWHSLSFRKERNGRWELGRVSTRSACETCREPSCPALIRSFSFSQNVCHASYMRLSAWCLVWFLFCFSLSFILVITIITVITFDDEVRSMPNPGEQRKKLKEAAREVTGSEPRDVFMIANSIPDQEFDPAYKKEVLKMLERALKCGELSVKMRQAQRESFKRSLSEPRGRAEKSPVENTEEPSYKSWSGWL